MTSNKPSEFYAQGSILFLGSGFSTGATNIRGTKLPAGAGLSDEFSKILGIPSNTYDLRTLSDEIESRDDLNLYQILYELFTVSRVADYQLDILRLPWRRIYTTNYDDSVEYAYRQLKKPHKTYDYSDEKPSKLANGSIVHLHGMIRNATIDNAHTQLILNEKSYVRQHFDQSPWYSDFIRDLRFCHACFFVGYNLSDYHIAALLLQDPTLREKTYFVTRAPVDSIFENRISPYGRILDVGAEGFTDLCKSIPSAPSATNPYSLKAFRYLDPLKDKKTLLPPTALEIMNLVTYGSFNSQRCLSTLPGGDYIVPRTDKADEALRQIETSRCLLVHSRIGNGKSIFLYILAHKFSTNGYECFLCHQNPIEVQHEIDLLTTYKKIVIFFDSYNTAIDLTGQLADLLPNAKFIVTARSGIQEVRLHEVKASLPKPLYRIDLNHPNKDEMSAFKRLLDHSGIRAKGLEQTIDKCHDFREVVLSLYDHQEIREKIRVELEPLLKERKISQVFVLTHIFQFLGLDIDPSFLRTVTNTDAYAEMARFRETSSEVFKLDDESIQVRSAVFSEYIMLNHFNSEDIIECVYLSIVESVKRKAERGYRTILSSLMRYSQLKYILRNELSNATLLRNLFDRLHRDKDVNNEPLFWLQYSILMTDQNDLEAAENFLETAYSRASINPRFLTFQIDTFSLKLYLLIEQNSKNDSSVKRFTKIIDQMELVMSMLETESNRFHAVQVLEGVYPFVTARSTTLTLNEKNALSLNLDRLIARLNDCSDQERMYTGSEKIKNNLSRAKVVMLKSAAH